jgi:hypothetical protein
MAKDICASLSTFSWTFPDSITWNGFFEGRGRRLSMLRNENNIVVENSQNVFFILFNIVILKKYFLV